MRGSFPPKPRYGSSVTRLTKGKTCLQRQLSSEFRLSLLLRWGEAVVLTSDDIRGDRVYINKSIHGGTKSQSGNRVVPLVGEFASFPKSPKTLRKVLDPHGIHIHSLRHTYAYILKSQGIHVTTAQKLMGHSDPKITMAIYTRVLDNEIESAGAILRRMTN